MLDDQYKKFLGKALDVVEKNPEFKQQIERKMGKVADEVLKDKFKPEDQEEKDE